MLYKREKMFLFIVLINNDYFRLSAPLMEGALNRIWALIREGRLLNFLDYQGALIREGLKSCWALIRIITVMNVRYMQ